MFLIIFFLVFIYSWLCWVSVAVWAFSLVAASRGYSSCGARASHCTGFRAYGLQHLQHSGLEALRHVGSSQARDRTCVPYTGRWILSLPLSHLSSWDSRIYKCQKNKNKKNCAYYMKTETIKTKHNEKIHRIPARISNTLTPSEFFSSLGVVRTTVLEAQSRESRREQGHAPPGGWRGCSAPAPPHRLPPGASGISWLVDERLSSVRLCADFCFL